MKNVMINALVRISVLYPLNDTDPETGEKIYENESEALEDASGRLYDALYDGLSMRTSETIDFSVEHSEYKILEVGE